MTTITTPAPAGTSTILEHKTGDHVDPATAAAQADSYKQLTAPPAPTPAEAIASRIEVPTLLPVGYKGYPIDHLSHSAIQRYMLCPDDYRRYYVLGERGAPSGSMFLGSRVDDTVGIYYDNQIAGHDTLTLEQLEDAFRQNWKEGLEKENALRGIEWDDGLTETGAFEMGLEGVRMTHAELIPKLGRGVASQRKFEFKLSPLVQWTIIGYVDLDTVRSQRVFLDPHGAILAIHDTGYAEPTVEMPYEDAPADLRPPLTDAKDNPLTLEQAKELVQTTTQAREAAEAEGKSRKPRIFEIPTVEVPISRLAGKVVDQDVYGIVDYKVKNAPIAQYKADVDLQATSYLAERALVAGQPAHDFRFAQVAKPKEGKRQNMSTALVGTTRTREQMTMVLTRYAMVAQQIVASYEQFGPDNPWGFAEPGHWKCSPNAEGTAGRFCSHWQNCPMGVGF